MNDCALAWCAGFLDGEGYFGITPPRRESPDLRGVCVRVGQIQRQPLERLALTLGGTIFVPTRRTSSGNTVYVWSLNGTRQIRRSLPDLLPYLTIKHADASDVLAYAQLCQRRRPVPPEVVAERERAYQAWKGRRSP
jgi:hypothetical protein